MEQCRARRFVAPRLGSVEGEDSDRDRVCQAYDRHYKNWLKKVTARVQIRTYVEQNFSMLSVIVRSDETRERSAQCAQCMSRVFHSSVRDAEVHLRESPSLAPLHLGESSAARRRQLEER